MDVLISLKTEICDTIVAYSAGLRQGGRRQLVTHLCWALGAYASRVAEASSSESQSDQHLRDFHQALEMLVYERVSVARWLTAATPSISNRSTIDDDRGDDADVAEDVDENVSDKNTEADAELRRRCVQKANELRAESRLLSVVVSALTKLASHQTDLVPRVLDCFSKILAHDARDALDAEVIRRAEESTRMLSYPSALSLLSQLRGGVCDSGGVLLSRLQPGRLGICPSRSLYTIERE